MELKALLARPPGSTTEVTLRVKCPNGTQLQWQTLCSCSIPLDGFDMCGPQLICRVTEMHRLSAASSGDVPAHKAPSPLRAVRSGRSSSHGGVDNPLGLSYLASHSAAETSPSKDGEAVLKALKEHGVHDARWAAKNVYMIQGKRVYITLRGGELVVRVGGSVVPMLNFLEQLQRCAAYLHTTLPWLRVR